LVRGEKEAPGLGRGLEVKRIGKEDQSDSENQGEDLKERL